MPLSINHLHAKHQVFEPVSRRNRVCPLRAIISSICAKIMQFFKWLFSPCCKTKMSATSRVMDEGKVVDSGERVIHFSDNTPLYDRTAKKVFKIVPCSTQVYNANRQEMESSLDVFYLQDKKILFFSNLDATLIFSYNANTKCVIAEDTQIEGVYKITEQERSGVNNEWLVDTSKQFIVNTLGVGGVPLSSESVYLVESQIKFDYQSLPSQSQISRSQDPTMPKILIKA